MAGKGRFRIPTLEEMEQVEQQETVLSRQPQPKSTVGPGTKSPQAQTASTETSGPSLTASPKKRMLSQKALLSRQPLSMKVNTGSRPKAPETPDNRSSANTATGSNKPSAVASGSTESSLTHQISVPWTSVQASSVRREESTALIGMETEMSARNPLFKSRTPGDRSDSTSSVRESRVQQTVPAGSEHAKQSKEDVDTVRADTLPTLAKLGKTNSLVVNPRQRGNPILKYVRNVPWEYGNIVPDYVMGQCNCALFLSLRYHQLNPDYIHARLKQLGRSFDLRVLLVQVDIKDPHHLLKELAKICILADCTLMLAFSAEEAGRYLETYKVYENKPAEAIMERTDSNFSVQLNDCLTRVKAVNKTDCATLLTTFRSLQGIMEASVEDLSLCPGFGPQKAKRLHDVFREPFLVAKKQRANAVD